MPTTDFPANARAMPDDKARHKEIAKLVSLMDDELGATERLIRCTAALLNVMTGKSKAIDKDSILDMVSAAAAGLDSAIEMHASVCEQWNILFAMTREDVGND